MLTMITENLQICCYNINGLGVQKSKLSDAELIELVSKYDVVFILETWLKNSADLDLSHLSISTFFVKCRSQISSRVNRGNGGILCMIKDTIKNGIKFLGSRSDDLLWIQLNKDFFNLKDDLYVCGTYISPAEQTAAVYINVEESVFDVLEDEETYYSGLGDVAILGDFNARIGLSNCLPVTSTNNTGPTSDPNILLPDVVTLQRNSCDPTETNANGKKYMELCTAGELCILNGRCHGDLQGKFTSHQHNGRSVIDFGMVSYSFLNSVISFEICDMLTISDHAPILLSIKVNTKLENEEICLPKFPPLSRLVWSPEKK